MAADFYYDLGSPYAWLTAERIDRLFEEAEKRPPVWKPVLLGGLFREFDRGSWAQTDVRDEGMAEIKKRAAEYGLPPVIWPEPWPDSYLYAMRAATWAETRGHGVTFALAAMRRSFTTGLDLAVPGNVLIVAVEEGLDPAELDAAVRTTETKDLLKANTAKAAGLGVFGVPTVVAGGEIFWGDDRLPEALRAA